LKGREEKVTYVFEKPQLLSSFLHEVADLFLGEFFDVWKVSEVPIANGDLLDWRFFSIQAVQPSKSSLAPPKPCSSPQAL
jgi:hypothetical protein